MHHGGVSHGKEIIRQEWVCKWKPGCFKARLVVKGFM